ncbi:hypothetical protein Godav_019068 [Gossypium davidsonii]|uniref:U6 snRNA-associated Sm-like protein LSm8 n=2 Tax=Gossypium TaxID=3633 RepID=A0A7J8QYH4_GOSDV|nr:hypothetical protein [Gossypium davidsonii]MBA0641577.1 hypothetical protein [Gossypium klotzschianum]
MSIFCRSYCVLALFIVFVYLSNSEPSPLCTETISVITNDGRNILVYPNLQHYSFAFPLPNAKGVLKGFDQATNIILDESHERVYSTKEGVQQLVLGLYIIRGDNISVVGELDEELDSALDLSNLRAHPLKPVIH